MTLDEAKKLEHGDRVLVEMEVMKDSFFGETVSAGAVYIRAVGMENVAAAVKPEFIRKKLEPTTRRKFKALDIVFAQGAYWIVGQNERDDGSVLVGMMGAISRYKHKDLELICAAENREDRKGAE